MRKASLLFVTVCTAVLLAACGHNDDDDVAHDGMPTQPPVGGTPAQPSDAFAAQVSTVVATAADDNEPATVEAVVTTMPEDAEPVAVDK